MVICEGCAYYLNSILVEHNDETTLKRILDEGKLLVEEMGGILVAVSGDNFSGVVLPFRLFVLEFTNHSVPMSCPFNTTGNQ